MKIKDKKSKRNKRSKATGAAAAELRKSLHVRVVKDKTKYNKKEKHKNRRFNYD